MKEIKEGKEYKQLYPHLFSPITIRGQVIKNRLVSSPHSGGPVLVREGKDGFMNFTETAARYFANIARGGAGIVHTGHLGVDPKYSLGSNCEKFNFFSEDIHEAQLSVMHMMTDMIHAYGAKASIELNHGGHYGAPYEGDTRLGPCTVTLSNGVKVAGMDEEEMDRVAECFANAALIGKRGGYDIVNIHAGHNWLLSSFFSPLTNKRTDKYGGSVENRARFPKMVFERIRGKVGDDMIIQMRFSANEGMPGGITLDEVLETMKILEDTVDIMQCSAGKIWTPEASALLFPLQYMKHGHNADISVNLTGKTKMKLEAIGGINDPAMADKFIADGVSDLVGMARSFIADPMWGEKARSGRVDEIRPCIRCLRCMDYCVPAQTGASVCTVNPTRRLFEKLPDAEPFRTKDVVVIGGGPAGMEAAYELALKGHRVTLFEKEDKLGGRLEFADHVAFKKDIKRYREYLVNMVNKTERIEIKLGVKATPELVRDLCPDAVVVAVGADKFIPGIPGADGANVVHAVDTFGKEDTLGDKVVIVGGGMVGCEETVHLQSMGKQVDIVEMADELMAEAEDLLDERFLTEFFMTHEYKDDFHDLYELPEIDRVRIHKSSSCVEVNEKGIWAKDKEGKRTFIEADTVIMATGFRPNAKVKEAYAGIAHDVIFIGDCEKIGDILNTSTSGYCAALRI